ncbi:unnamed protein product [Ilex paraguariensis]|uniref:Uncharacterized protein n=1 Tax=Ilex paraguariensis TaxID=185542 RepID=A0ABC8T719_9AQUA
MDTTVGYEIKAHIDVDDDDEVQACMNMDSSARAVEKLLDYTFKDKSLIEEALTHSSRTNSATYQRLEFFGDAALGLAVSKYLFFTYPNIDSGQLTTLRSLNVSTERFARVAARHGLYRYVQRHNIGVLDKNVRDFTAAVKQEDETTLYGGAVKAPKILADIVESVAAAVYVDCGFDLKTLWTKFRGLLEPIVTLDVLEQQPQMVKTLFKLCQKNGKMLDIRQWREGEKHSTSICVDGEFISSGCSEQREKSKLLAAEEALQKLSDTTTNDRMATDPVNELNQTNEMDGTKQKLYELCAKNKWPKPSYRIERELGPDHKKRFICSVQIKAFEGVLSEDGDEKSSVKDAERSAASMMLRSFQETEQI